jgi:D-galactarolactone cycloisomerase
MTIKSVTALPLALPLRPGSSRPAFAGRLLDVARMTLVRVETTDGAVGWGETFSHVAWQPAHVALRDVVAPLAEGRDESDIGALSLELQRTLHLFGRGGAMLYALSGLEIALWDIAGKRAGRSVAELLGGARRCLPMRACRATATRRPWPAMPRRLPRAATARSSCTRSAPSRSPLPGARWAQVWP